MPRVGRPDLPSPLLSEHYPRVASQYSAIASDGKGAKDAKEAAMLLAVAEGHIYNEEEEEALTAAQDALAHFRSVSEFAGMADALHVIIQCYVIQGRVAEAATLAKDELGTFKKAGKKAQEAKMLMSLSEAKAKNSKDIDEAVACSKEAVTLFQEVRDEKMEAFAQLCAARVLALKGKKDAESLKEADTSAAQALAIFKKIGEKKGEAAALHMTAEVKAASGEMGQAIDLAEGAVTLLQDIRQHKLEAFELNAIALWYLRSGKPFKALQFAEDALDIIRNLGASKKKEVETLSTIVQAYIAKGLTPKAVKVATGALSRFQSAGETRAEAETYRVLYSAYSANGDAEKAALALEKALDAAEGAGDKELEAQLLCEASESNLRTGKSDDAAEKATRALGIMQDAKNWDGLNRALQCLVSASIAQEDLVKAVDLAKETREMLESTGDSKAEAAACLILSQAHSAAGSSDLAAAAAKAANEIAYQEDDEALEANALDQLTSVYMDSGKYEKAARAAESSRRIWKTMEDLPRECKALDQVAKAQVHQAYKKQAGSKSAGAVAGIFDKATKAANECIALAEDLPATENGRAFMANSKSVLSQVHAALGESEEAWDTAKAASDLFAEAGDEKGGAYASVLMAQANVQQQKWEKALKEANAAMKGFKKFNDAGGKEFAQTLIDKIQKAMPKPEPVFMPQQFGGMTGAWKTPGPGMPGGGMQMAMPQGGGGGGGGGELTRTGNALDMSNISEDIVQSKVKEISMAIIGDDEDVELDTPLMEAGLTSSTAVVLRDELMKDLPGVNLPPTLIFDYPSIAGITEFVMEKVGK